MLKRLTLYNFRKHGYIDLTFDESQLIYITGVNGAGKSTILEAILYAFYGESRHGRRDLDALVKRGAELEGMQVDLEFSVGEDLYKVSRRRDGKAASALLYGNDIPLYEGNGAVTGAITNILGMDCSTFKLAVISQQKDIDGLTSLRPGDRVEAVKKLLKLDTLSTARDHFYDSYKENKRLALLVKPAGGRDGYETEIAILNEKLLQYSSEKDSLLSQLAELNVKTQDLIQKESDYRSLLMILDNKKQRLESDRSELGSVLAELGSLKLHNLAESYRDPDLISIDLEQAQISKQEQENMAAIAELREFHTSEMEKCKVRINALKSRSAAEVRDELGQAQADLCQLEDERKNHLQIVVDARREFDLKNAKLELIGKSYSFEDGCPTCFREISEAEISHAVNVSQARMVDIQNDISFLASNIKSLEKSCASTDLKIDELRSRISSLNNELASIAYIDKENEDLMVRYNAHKLQLSRISSVNKPHHDYSTDIEMLREELKVSKAYQALKHENAVTEAKVHELKRSAERLSLGIQVLEQELVKPIDADLHRHHEMYTLCVEEQLSLQEMINSVNDYISQVTALIGVKVAELQRFDLDFSKSKEYEKEALIKYKASKVLDKVILKVSNSSIPHLESVLSELLDKMSESRFTKVRIDPDYTICVFDEGEYRSLNDISGGEFDLVSLSLRLALAELLLDTVGNPCGFLILDECFGSQDESRRRSILGGLRSVRERFPQIFLISHVENVDDYADYTVHLGGDLIKEEGNLVSLA